MPFPVFQEFQQYSVKVRRATGLENSAGSSGMKFSYGSKKLGDGLFNLIQRIFEVVTHMDIL